MRERHRGERAEKNTEGAGLRETEERNRAERETHTHRGDKAERNTERTGLRETAKVTVLRETEERNRAERGIEKEQG
jgi:hypothetical protein